MTRTLHLARVHVVDCENPAMLAGLYRTLADADAALARAYTAEAAPAGKPYSRLEYVIVWTDGEQLHDRAYLTDGGVREGLRRGGILRHYLWRDARILAGSPYVPVRAVGVARLQRLEASVELDDAEPRNGGPWTGPSLMPDPSAVIAQLRNRFATRRRLVATVGPHSDRSPPGAAVSAFPATTHADVRYVANFVSLALHRDVAALGWNHAVGVWDFWRSILDAVETLLHLGDDTDEYTDNEGFWVHQLPALAHRLLDVQAASDPDRVRNGRLTFRPVGARGEPYPAWVQDLRGRSGVYVIRERQADGSMPLVYVGQSSGDRLYDTLTRHFQTWHRAKDHWRGQYTDQHDPGLTYERATVDAAVLVTPARHALEMEQRLIRRLSPRDNIVGQARTADDEAAAAWYAAGAAAPDDTAAVPF
ncbi:MAG: hypothetical protein IPL61_12535 [Myxococcales bacterium]|nr:hypothetical protein [Myxococcales bacterium]